MMIDDEDRALFRAEMASVKPLKLSGKKVFTFPSSPKKISPSVPLLSSYSLRESLKSQHPQYEQENQKEETNTEAQPNFLNSNDMGVEWLSAEQMLCYCSSGVSSQQFKQLRLGKLTINAVLDLHGDTVDSAAERLFRFMTRAYAGHCRVVKIIHGKGLHAADGTAKIKSHVVRWLQQFECVLAFHSAPASLGGRGAVLVMLNRNNRGNNRG